MPAIKTDLNKNTSANIHDNFADVGKLIERKFTKIKNTDVYPGLVSRLWVAKLLATLPIAHCPFTLKKAFRLLPFTFLLLLTIASCSRKPYAATDRVYRKQAKAYSKTIRLTEPIALTDSAGAAIPGSWVGSVNFGIRKPNFVIIHYTEQNSADETLKTFTLKRTQVSANYVVGKDGRVYHMVSDYLRAYQAGVSKWGSVTDMNSCSVGIEIDNNGDEPFNDVQINSVLALLAKLKKTYNIPTANFIGHEDIAPTRKPDPGPYFPWKKLAARGFGFWSDDVLELAPPGFDYETALRLIGYDTTNLNAAVVAFKRHFVQTDIKPQLTQLDLNVLYNVYRKY